MTNASTLAGARPAEAARIYRADLHLAPGIDVDSPAQYGMLAVLEAWGRAAILIDGHGRVVRLNAAAQALVGHGVLISQGRLRAWSRPADAALQALLADAVAEATSHNALGLALPRPDGRPLIVHGAPLPDGTADIFGQARALVTLTKLSPPTRAGVALLARAYGLTPAEQALCQHLAAGAGLSDAAAALGVSMSTVRTHLKGSFLKTGTHRQSELIALLGQTAYSLWAGAEPPPPPGARQARTSAAFRAEQRAG